MRLRALLLFALCVPMMLAGQQTSQQPSNTSQPPAPATTSVGPSSGHHYTNVDGQSVHSPMAAPSAPAGATAKCKDGTYSFSQHARGTCSYHGGVATWLVH